MTDLTRRNGLLGLAGLTGLGACGMAPRPSIGIRTIPLDLSGPRPTAQLMLGRTGPGTAIFDTGAAASVIQLPFARRAALPDQGPAGASGPGGREIMGYRTSISGRLGDAAFENALAVALDIPLPLPGIDAVISPGVFGGWLVAFDFAGSRAEVMDRSAVNTPRGKPGGYTGGLNPFAMTSLPASTVVLPGGLSEVMVVDTGSARGLVMPAEMATRLPLKGPLEPAEELRQVGISYNASKGVISGTVRIGEVSFKDPEVTFGEGMKEGHVGIRLLRATRLVLDSERRRTWVLPPA